MKIFLSHNSKDKDIIEPIALKLADIFGRENVFYDSWSIQPGDGIIDKMNNGLLDMDYFLFFVSRNSLQSNMVKMEWQNALFKATNGSCKFIPIKLDDCVMPMVLLHNLYIDFYNYGFDVGLSQIIEVLKGYNTFTLRNIEFSNVISKIRHINNSSIDVEISAQKFQEPISHYLVIFSNDPSTIVLTLKTDSFHSGNRGNDIQLSDGKKYNWISFAVSRATTPGFPVRFTLETNDKSDINFCGILREDKENHFVLIKQFFI